MNLNFIRIRSFSVRFKITLNENPRITCFFLLENIPDGFKRTNLFVVCVSLSILNDQIYICFLIDITDINTDKIHMLTNRLKSYLVIVISREKKPNDTFKRRKKKKNNNLYLNRFVSLR